MKKLIGSILSLLFAALLCYVGFWQNPNYSDLDIFIAQNKVGVHKLGNQSDLTMPEVEMLWGQYEEKSSADKFVWPFNLSQEMRSLYRSVIWPNRGAVLWFLFFIVSLVSILVAFVPASRRRKRFLDHLLLELAKQLNINHTEDVRVTLYLPCRGYRFLFPYLWRTIASPSRFLVHWKKNLIVYHLIRIPLPWKKYLIQYARYRYGRHHDEILTSTYFNIPDNEQNAKGVVERAWATGHRKARFCQLTEGSLDIFSSLQKLKSQNTDLYTAVDNYMNAGFFKKDFNFLRSLHRYPRNMAAFALTDEGNGSCQTGVLVIDDSRYDRTLNHLNPDVVVPYGRTIQDAITVFSN